MEDAKKQKNINAARCPELSCHEIFEKWRVRDTQSLKGGEAIAYREDLLESNQRYGKAFDIVLSHTSPAELEAFWKPFGVAPQSLHSPKSVHSVHSMRAAGARKTVDEENIDLGEGTLLSEKSSSQFSVLQNPMFASSRQATSRQATSRQPTSRQATSRIPPHMAANTATHSHSIRSNSLFALEDIEVEQLEGDEDFDAWRSSRTGSKVEVHQNHPHHHGGLGSRA
jgi:hypothetical protein